MGILEAWFPLGSYSGFCERIYGGLRGWDLNPILRMKSSDLGIADCCVTT